MARLGPIFHDWLADLKSEWNTVKTAVTTEVNPDISRGAGGYTTEIEVTATDAITATLAEHAKEKDARICVLNFASYKTPGGGFVNGSLAQEEAICYCSNLYPSLLKNWQWYENHKKTLNRGAYTDECIMSHDVTLLASEPGKLIPHDQRFLFDVITCAAPNWTSVIRYNADDQTAFDMLFKAAFNRVQYLMQILAGYDYDTIILGAFGCGVFKNDPEAIAEAFYYALTELLPGAFKRVVFAIPDQSSINFRTFAKQFAEGSSANGKTSVFH